MVAVQMQTLPNCHNIHFNKTNMLNNIQFVIPSNEHIWNSLDGETLVAQGCGGAATEAVGNHCSRSPQLLETAHMTLH